MSDAEKMFVCFVRGLNVFGRSQITIPEQQARCASVFERSGQNIKFVVAHTNTGNLAVIGSSGISPEIVQRLICNAIGKPCAVVGPSTIERIASALETWPPPTREDHQRWTLGFALLCEGHVSAAALDPTRRACSR